MKKLNLFFTCLLISASTIVCHANDYEEVGYDDLVRQISAKKRSYETRRDPHPFDEVKIHTGVGYVNSFSQMRINNKDVQRYQNGIHLALGVDLFSENWFAETSFRNFGLTNYGSEELILRELDLKFGYKDNFKHPVIFRFQGGLANRYLRISDPATGTLVDDTTPMLMGSAGVAAQLSTVVAVGLDLAGKSALISRTADKSAFDFTFEVKGSF